MQEMRRSGRFLSCLLVIFFLIVTTSGCAWWRKEPEPNPQAMYENAMNLFQRKKYERAAEAFKRFKEEFPLSDYTPLVELRIADSYFFDKNYAEAIVQYEEFRKLHPTHAEIPYVIYQLGMCHYRQMLSLDRDQTETEKAIEQFRYLIENHPQSPQASEASIRMKVAIKQLADHEYYIARFYLRMKKYKAALGRFEAVLQKYPGLGFEERIKPLIVKCQEEIGKEEQKRKEKEAGEEKEKEELEEKKKVRAQDTEKSG